MKEYKYKFLKYNVRKADNKSEFYIELYYISTFENCLEYKKCIKRVSFTFIGSILYFSSIDNYPYIQHSEY